MAGKRWLEVELVRTVFEPGDLVVGTANVDPDCMPYVSSIEANVFGSAKVSFSEEDPGIIYKGFKSNVYVNKKVLLDDSVLVYKKPEPMLIQLEEDQNAPPFCNLQEHYILDNSENYEPPPSYRVRKFVFRIKLPENGLENTFTAPQSPISIKYFVTASLFDDGGNIVSQCVRPITIVNSNSVPVTSSTKTVEIERSKMVFVDVELPQKIFRPLEKLDATVTIQNKCTSSIRYAHFNIIQRITCTGWLPGTNLKSTTTKDLNLNGVGLPEEQKKIKPGSCISYTPEYNITSVPPSFAIENFARVEYLVRLVFGKSPNNIYGQVTVPLRIGSQTPQ